jgi:hypothetical protein
MQWLVANDRSRVLRLAAYQDSAIVPTMLINLEDIAMKTSSIPLRSLNVALCGAAILLLGACSPTPSTITYEQVGACNANEVGAQDSLAFVFFRIVDIDNSKTSAAYTFHPQDLWINSGDQISGYNFIATGQQASLLGFPPLQSAVSVPAGADVPINKYVVFLVQTVNPDAPTEANSTSYFLLYHTPPNEVGKLLVRTNAQQTSWPDTHKCSDIKFPKFIIAPSPKRQGISN